MIEQTPTDTTEETQEILAAEEIQQIKHKSVSGAMSFVVRTLILNAIGLVTAFVLSGFLSPQDFGTYGYVTQFIAFLIFFSDIGLAASLVQKKTEPTLTDYRTAFTIQQALAWFIFGVVLLISKTGIIQQTVGNNGVWVLLSLGLSFPLATLKTISSIQLERQLDFSKMVIPQIFEQLVFNGLLIVFAFKGFGVMSYAYAIIARSIVGVIVMFAIQPWKMGFALSHDSAKSLLNFGAKFQLNDLLARIKDNLFYIVLARFVSPIEYGYISWAKSWSMYPYTMTVQNVMAVTFPTFSRLQHHKEALSKAINKSLFFITFAIFPLIVGMSIFILPLVHVIGKYQKWQPAVLTFILFSLSIGWSAVSSPLTNTLNAIGQIGTTLKLMILWTILTWVLTFPALQWFGFNGVALAAFAIAFTSVLPIYYVKKHVPISVWENTWRQLFAAAGMAVVGFLGLNWWSRSLLWMLLGMSVVGVSYFGLFCLVGYKKLVVEVKSLLHKA